MGVNPHKQGPTPPDIKPFSIDLFREVYNAYQKDLGKEFMGKHIGMVAMHLDDTQGRIECCGTYSVLRCMVSLLVMRLATTQATIIYEKSQGRNNPGLKGTAQLILEEVKNDITRLDNMDHSFHSKKGVGLAK